MKRIAELDSLRAIAVVLVLFHHTPFIRQTPRLVFLSAIGWLGVDLFFVLSGFLITAIILRQVDRSHFFRSFYLRRSLRIFPIYYVSIAFVFAFTEALFNHPFRIDELIYHLTYTQYVPFYWSDIAPIHPVLQHTWSLAVEEQFYLIWPATIWLTGRRGLLGLIPLVVFAAVWARTQGFNWQLLLTRCDGLAVGALVAVGMERLSRATMIRAATSVAVVASTYVVWGRLLVRFLRSAFPASSPEITNFTSAVNLLVFNVLSACVIALVSLYAGHRWLGWLRLRPLAFVGLISYGIYLYHVPVFRLVEKLHLSLPAEAIVANGISLAVAVMSWFVIEQPILKLKDRFTYRS
jgi:peptidoglycan/LPS O-acetylase OafA/YrhL